MSVRIPVSALYDFMNEVFIKLGVPADDAKICSDILIESDLRGIESHGIGRLKMYYDRINQGIQSPVTQIEVIKNKAATAVWDGQHGMGHVIGYRAMQAAIEKAQQYGIGCVAVRNSTHYGICGYYASMAIEKNMIGMTFTNARPSVCPTNGVSPMLGTNPICFGAPADYDYPFLYDAATSISQRGKIELLDRAEEETPAEWAIDLNGKPYTDTKKLLRALIDMDASLLPVGGVQEVSGSHKGYGLSTMVEILCAALQDGAYLHQLHGSDENGNPAPYRLGHLFMAINIDFFVDIESFKKTTGDIMRQLQNSQLMPGEDHIFVAGEKEYLSAIKVREMGVEVNANLLKNIDIMQRELQINMLDLELYSSK